MFITITIALNVHILRQKSINKIKKIIKFLKEPLWEIKALNQL